MERLVIGVPARNEAATIADLAGDLEMGAALLGEGIQSEIVLAYQPGGDETLERWDALHLRIPHRVLYSLEDERGKGRNIKRLIGYAREVDAHLLLVDGDLRFSGSSNLGHFAGTEQFSRGGLVLPLWCRPRGQGNSTDFLACPLLYARYGAGIRQPLAGQMLLTNKMLNTTDLDALPDDYGVDVALTMHALNEGLPVDQVVVPFPGHEAGANSRRIMENVATVMLASLEPRLATRRGDIGWPPEWWEGQATLPPSSRSLRGLIEELASSEQQNHFTALLTAPPLEVRDFWCDRLATAIRSAQAGYPIEPLVADLVGPFLVHAEYRRQAQVDFAGAERYVADLSRRLADAIS